MKGQEAKRRLPRYPAYRGSEVEWLEEVPGGWGVRRLKHVAARRIINGVGEPGSYEDPQWPRYVRITDIAGPRRLRTDTFKSLPPELAAQAPFYVGDLLLAAVGATFGKSYLHCEDCGPVCFAGYLVRFSPGPDVESGFAAYWTETTTYWALVRSRVVQSTIQNFSAAKYQELPFPLPPLPEQRAIATFLDRETAKIDTLVAKKERLLELLDEKRTALISQAVTQGLDPAVSMKDSGVEWLGEVPEGWEVVPLKAVSTLQAGVTLGRKESGPNPVRRPYLRVANVQDGYLDLSDMAEIEVPETAVRRYELQVLDVVVTEGGDFDKLGRGYVWGGQIHGCLHQNHVFAVRATRGALWPQFFALLTTSRYGRAYFTATSKQSTNLASTNSQKLKNLPIPLPPLPEQHAIAAYLDRETARIDALKAKIQKAIDLLKEYRTALISAAVTGKIDVRGEVAEPAT